MLKHGEKLIKPDDDKNGYYQSAEPVEEGG
jgi:hypothetical protein